MEQSSLVMDITADVTLKALVTVFGLFLKGAYVQMLGCMVSCQYLSRRPVQTTHDLWSH